GWSMPFFHTADNVHILVRFHAITHGPENRGLIRWVDVLVHRNDDLADTGMKRAGGVQRAPDFGFIGTAHLDDNQLISVGERLVHFHPKNTGDTAFIAEVHQHEAVVANFTNHR